MPHPLLPSNTILLEFSAEPFYLYNFCAIYGFSLFENLAIDSDRRAPHYSRYFFLYVENAGNNPLLNVFTTYADVAPTAVTPAITRTINNTMFVLIITPRIF